MTKAPKKVAKKVIEKESICLSVLYANYIRNHITKGS